MFQQKGNKTKNTVKLNLIKIKNMKTQSNSYDIFNSSGNLEMSITASNLTEAKEMMVQLYKEGKIRSLYGKVKRSWQGGVYGSR